MTATTPQTSVRLLGVDGGGTTTEAWLAEPGCHVLGRGTSGPSNAKAVGPEAARWALDSAIRGAFHAAGLTPAPVDVICLGLAGFDRPDDREILAGWADDAQVGPPACHGQRRRPCRRGRYTEGLGCRGDRGHRLDRGGPCDGRAHRTAPGAGDT